MTDLYDRVYQILFRRLTPSEIETKFFLPVPDVGVDIRMPVAMSFSCEQALTKSPNVLDLKIYNLAPRTRAELQLEGVILRFGAGYVQGGPRRLFVGDVAFANSQKKGTEWITEVQVRDGLRSFAGARSDRSFKGGSKVIDVLRFVASTMQLKLPRELEVSADLQKQFSAGFSMSGKSRDELTRLLAPFGYGWSIQNGALQILRDEDLAPGATREISVETGMLDSPEFGKPEAKGKPPKRTVSIKLYPELQPGGRVNIISRGLSGLHKIVKLRHTGDTQTDDWKTQLEVEPIK